MTGPRPGAARRGPGASGSESAGPGTSQVIAFEYEDVAPYPTCDDRPDVIAIGKLQELRVLITYSSCQPVAIESDTAR